MLTDLCETAHNWFEVGKYHGTFNIVGGSIQPLDFLKDGQYFRIVGSIFNDGVYQYPTADLTDEEFEGEIWAMGGSQLAYALRLLEVKEKIDTLEAELSNESDLQSESFAGYSYSKAIGKSSPKMVMLESLKEQYNKGIAKIRRPIL